MTDHEAIARRILTEECNDLCRCGGMGPEDQGVCDACRFYHAAWPNVAQALAETEAAAWDAAVEAAAGECVSITANMIREAKRTDGDEAAEYEVSAGVARHCANAIRALRKARP